MKSQVSLSLFFGCLLIAAAIYFRPGPSVSEASALAVTPSELAPPTEPSSSEGTGSAPVTTAEAAPDGPPPVPSEREISVGGFRLRVVLDQAAILDGDRDGHLLVEVKPDPAQTRVRARVAMTLVMDTSGSMAGQKMDDARAAARHLIAGLADDDLVSIVSYSDDAETVMQPALVGSARYLADRAIDRMVPSGNTCVSCGLLTAWTTIRDFSPYVRRVVVISDGIANRGTTSDSEIHRLARAWSHYGIVTTTIGLGHDYNGEFMSQLATGGLGNYYFIPESEEIARVLSREIALSSSVVARDVVLVIRSRGGARISIGHNRGAEFDQGDVVIRLGDLSSLSGGQYVFPIAFADEIGEVGDVIVQYAGVSGHVETASLPVSVSRARSAREAEESRRPEVLSRNEVLESSANVQVAMEEYNRGDVGAATQRLEAAREALEQASRDFADEDLSAEAVRLDNLSSAIQAAPAAAAPAGRSLVLQNQARAAEIQGGAGVSEGALYHDTTVR